MATQKNVSFEFKNQIVPRYIEPLFLQMEYGQWYDSIELRRYLRAGGLEVEGKNIVQAHIVLWAKAGLGEVKRGERNLNLFRLTPLAKQVIDLYSTNQELFFDLLHFLFYSAWPRSRNLSQAPFWVYKQACDKLWSIAPSRADTFNLTAQMQTESRLAFPDHSPAFSERSVRSVLVWFQALTPPFIKKQGPRSELHSERRSYCTPQLFHLATDLLYTTEGLAYGTSLAMDDEKIAAICRVCLLDPDRFWEMASLADMAMREFEVRQGQWGTSLALSGPPRWIELPVFGPTEEDAADSAEDDEEEVDEV